MRVGFVGAGLMGAPMVRRLVEAGLDVVVSSRDPARLAGTGWTVVGSPARPPTAPRLSARSCPTVPR